jgi:hypothetical protein
MKTFAERLDAKRIEQAIGAAERLTRLRQLGEPIGFFRGVGNRK